MRKIRYYLTIKIATEDIHQILDRLAPVLTRMEHECIATPKTTYTKELSWMMIEEHEREIE